MVKIRTRFAVLDLEEQPVIHRDERRPPKTNAIRQHFTTRVTAVYDPALADNQLTRGHQALHLQLYR